MDTRYILGLAVAIVLGWFALGIIYNLRRGEAMLRWMRGGLPKIGERTTLRWLGSSVAELKIERAHAPFRRMETLVVLAPRDVPWMWIWALAVGRRDTLIFRSHLQTSPHVAFDIADPASWTGRMALEDAARQGWERDDLAGEALTIGGVAGVHPRVLVAPQGLLKAAQLSAARCLPVLERLSPDYVRLGVRREPPSLEVHVPFPDPRQRPAEDFFEALRELARAAAG